MERVVGIRRETKSHWETRVPLTPAAVRRLGTISELRFVVQPSPRRVYSDSEFVHAGARVSNDLSDASVVFGVKEIPPDLLQPRTTYLFFSHVIKGQSYNMPMLARLLELECTLIDYERVIDDRGRRLIFFGRFAGLAGMIDSLWALGQRFEWEGTKTALSQLLPAHQYDDLDQAKQAVRLVGKEISHNGLPATTRPIIIGVAGYGNVAAGVQEVLGELPMHELTPEQLLEAVNQPSYLTQQLYRVEFREQDCVEPVNANAAFDLDEYYREPGLYRSKFLPYLKGLTVLMNCNYWDDRYPRLVPCDELEQLWRGVARPQLRLIGDLACDVGGSIECMSSCTEPSNPVYVYDPATHLTTAGVAGNGPVILAVDILPAELPRDASQAFSDALAPYVRSVALADYDQELTNLKLPAEVLRAIVVHRGQLSPDYRYLERFLDHT